MRGTKEIPNRSRANTIPTKVFVTQVLLSLEFPLLIELRGSELETVLESASTFCNIIVFIDKSYVYTSN